MSTATPTIDTNQTAATLPHRQLGKTGLNVTTFALGGVKYNQLPDDQAATIVHRAIDLGVNYIDTAYCYENSERKIGPVMAERRGEVILATKTLKRTRDEALREFDESCGRLRTDRIDLWQMHDIANEEQIAQMGGKDGALRAAEELREAGRIRFIGVTGHRYPRVLVKAMEAFDYDTILVSVGPIHEAVRPFHAEVVPEATRRGMGVLGMKVYAAGWLQKHPEWCMRFVLGLEGVHAAVVGVDDLEQLEANVRFARDFAPLSDHERQALLAEARAVYEQKPDKAWFIHP